MCTNCDGHAIIGEISIGEQHPRIENTRLKDEVDHLCTFGGKFLGRPISSLASSMNPPTPNSSLELGVGNNGFGGLAAISSTLPFVPSEFGVGISNHLPMVPPKRPINITPIDRSLERSMYLELALSAMDELVKMGIRSLEGGREKLNLEEYFRAFTPCIGMKPNGFITEASRETGMAIINSLALVETLMDSNEWTEMFPCIISRTSTTDVVSSGMGGSRNGALQLMHAELQVLSPLVLVREVNFLRFCKQHSEGVWAVVDVSIDAVRETSSGSPTFSSCGDFPLAVLSKICLMDILRTLLWQVLVDKSSLYIQESWTAAIGSFRLSFSCLQHIFVREF